MGGAFGVRRLLRPGSEPSYAASLARFAAAAQSNQPVRPNLWDGYRSLAVVLAARRIGPHGPPSRLPELADESPDRT